MTDMADASKDEFVATVSEDYEARCWGCGLRLILPSYAPVFKCGWCGAITNQNERKHDNKWFWWRRLRDRSFVSIVLLFMLFIICGGMWAVYPIVYSISLFCGIFHSIVTAILSLMTITFFCLAAFRCAGTPPLIEWGSYPVVGEGHLDNYTFCQPCSKPKPPRAHHCRSCGMCILDMDHHCPFIGNCVGTANHRHFIGFLISVITGMIYVTIMSAFAGLRTWPSLQYKSPGHLTGMDTFLAWRTLKDILFALLSSTMFFSIRGLVLVYLFVASISVEIGITVLLWQQLCYIYEGKTYLSDLISQSTGGNEVREKDCKNILRFFGCPYSISRYLTSIRRSEKKHAK